MVGNGVVQECLPGHDAHVPGEREDEICERRGKVDVPATVGLEIDEGGLLALFDRGVVKQPRDDGARI